MASPVPHRFSQFSRSAFFCPIFLGTASGYFLRPAASRLLLSRLRPYTTGFPLIKQPLPLEAEAFAVGCPRKMGQKKEIFFMSYLNSVTIVGFVGADPEQRQARNNGSKFTVLSGATQRSWKNAEDEWVSKVEWHRVAIFRPRLAEAVLTNIKKVAHVLVEGSLASSTYEQPDGKSKKSKTSKITSWSVRADVVRRLDRGEPDPQASASETSEHSP